MHLYNTLQQEIGLKFPIELGFGHCGTREIQVAFNAFSSLHPSKNFLITWVTEDPVTDHECLKNFAVKPSGPGDLLAGKDLIVF